MAWVADLIEHTPPLLSYTWGASERELVLLRDWLEQLPADVVYSRPRLCLACVQILWMTASPSQLQAWLGAAITTLTASLSEQTHEDGLYPILNQKTQQDQENLLGEVLACTAFMLSYLGDGQATLSLCQQALALLSPENSMIRSLVCHAQFEAYYTSALNDAQAAIESGLQADSLAQVTGPGQAIALMGATALYMIGARAVA